MSEIGIQESDNGLSYDFGVAIAKGVSAQLAYTATKILAITGSIYALIDAGKDMDRMMVQNQLAMGGYANLLKSVDYFSKKVASGQSYFDVDDLVAGSRELSRAGIDVKKNFDLINNSARAIGGSFEDMSSVIRNGDYSALAEAGLITDRMATNMERTTFNQEQGTRRVLSLLKQAEAKGLFKNNVATLETQIMRIKQVYKSYMKAVLGDVRDPEGLWYTLTAAFKEFADYLSERMDKIKKIGMLLGRILTFVIRTVAGFMRYMGKVLRSVIGNTDDFFSNWQEKMLSFGLWLEILRVKIGSFFETWGPLVLKLWAVNSALNAMWMIGGALATRLRILRIILAGKGGLLGKTSGNGMITNFAKLQKFISASLIPTISSMGNAIWAALAPILPIVAIIAAILASVYLLWKYWDDIRGVTNGFNDILMLIFSTLNPMVGAIMLMSKYWNEVKTIGMNIWQIIVNISDMVVSLSQIVGNVLTVTFNGLWGIVTGIWDTFKDFGNWIDSVLTATFGSAWKTIKGIFWDPIKDMFAWIKEKVSGLFDFNLGAGFDKVVSWTKDLAGTTKDWAQNLAKAAGRESYASGGTSLEETQRKEIRKLAEQGKTDAEIAKVMDNGNFDKGLIAKERNAMKNGVVTMLPTASSGATVNNNSGGNVSKATINMYVDKNVNSGEVAKRVQKILKDGENNDERRTGS